MKISFDEFRDTPVEQISLLAPKSIIFAAGGTRRAAALAGIMDQDEYVSWSFAQMIKCFSLFAKYGVQHIITHAIVPTQWAETTSGYREGLVSMVAKGLASEKSIAIFKKLGWKCCLIWDDHIQELATTGNNLNDTFSDEEYSVTVYFFATSTYGVHYENLLKAARPGATTQAELIQKQFGQEIPPVELFVGFGKPVISAVVCPPILMAEFASTYWLQKPGYLTDEIDILKILYDFVITRNPEVDEQTDLTLDEMHTDAIMGLGKRVGPFWYPVFPAEAKENDNENKASYTSR